MAGRATGRKARGSKLPNNNHGPLRNVLSFSSSPQGIRSAQYNVLTSSKDNLDVCLLQYLSGKLPKLKISIKL